MTSTALVIDASVCLAWLLAEPAPTWVERLWSDLRDGSVRVSVPSVLWLEVGNALVHRRELSDDQVLEGLLRVEALGLASVEIDAPLRLRALELARRHALTTYDAAYLALADALDTKVATLDARLGEAAARLGRLHADDSARISEPLAPYGSVSVPALVPDGTSLAALGAHLAKLRSAAT